MVDQPTLVRAMGNPVIDSDEVAAYNNALRLADCTTLKRAAMFAAQIGHESIGMSVYRELWGPTSDQRNYDPSSGSKVSRDLGNTQPGDGFRFRGRGPIQVTGRSNYTKLSQWAHARGQVPTPTYFADNPDDLAQPRYGFLGAAWYWSTQRSMNDLSDRSTRDDITAATRAINGGTNGIGDRLARWRRCLDIGTALLPSDEGLDMAGLDDTQADQVWRGTAQFDGQAFEGAGGAYAPPGWLRKFLPKSYRDADPKRPGKFLGAWARDQLTAIANEVVTGVFDMNPNSTIDFDDGKGPIRLVDVPLDRQVNVVTAIRVIGARQAEAQGRKS